MPVYSLESFHSIPHTLPPPPQTLLGIFNQINEGSLSQINHLLYGPQFHVQSISINIFKPSSSESSCGFSDGKKEVKVTGIEQNLNTLVFILLVLWFLNPYSHVFLFLFCFRKTGKIHSPKFRLFIFQLSKFFVINLQQHLEIFIHV